MAPFIFWLGIKEIVYYQELVRSTLLSKEYFRRKEYIFIVFAYLIIIVNWRNSFLTTMFLNKRQSFFLSLFLSKATVRIHGA